jgi:hypothetical protein
MERGSKGILMEIHILGNLSMVKHMAKVFTHGGMGKCMMVNGTKDLSKAMEFGKV